MKSAVLGKGVLGLAVLVSAALPPSASASAVGHLVVGICGGGGVVVGANLIDWNPGSPSACLQLGLGTSITSVGDGTLTSASAAGTINDLPGVPGVTGFMSFTTGVNMHFDLDPVNGFGTGLPIDCHPASPAIGDSCSIPGSPFILTTTSNGTSVTLPAHGTILDTGDGTLSFWSGSFTTQVNNKSPFDIETVIQSGGFITSSFSGEFDVTADSPEPTSMALFGIGLVIVGAVRRYRRV
jgi:PEP-CTERM motif